MNQLVVSRLLQGIGGGLIAASSFAAAADLFPPQGRGQFEAYAGLTSGIAAVTGPLLGGFITDRFAWNWIFLLNVPTGDRAGLSESPLRGRRPQTGLPRHDGPGTCRGVRHDRPVVGKRRHRTCRRSVGIRGGHGRRVRARRVEIRSSHHAAGDLPQPGGRGVVDRGVAERLRILRKPPLRPLLLSGHPRHVRGRQRQPPGADRVGAGRRHRFFRTAPCQDRRLLPRAGGRRHGDTGNGDVPVFHHERGHQPDVGHGLRVRCRHRGGRHLVDVPACHSELGAVQAGGRWWTRWLPTL